MRILIIDDAADARLFIRTVLQKEGYDVIEMDSATDLEARLPELAPNLIVCDLMMPGRDGLSVCRSLQADPELAVPVVLVSSKIFEQDKQAALNAGASGYITKPIRASELVKVVNATLSTQTRVKMWGCRGSIATPEKATGLYGGNTACLELVLPGGSRFIFDAGTGIRILGNAIVSSSPMRAALFLTHFHWDHVQGLPFFVPLYIPGNEFHLYGPAESSEALVQTIEGQMGGAFFPISTNSFRSSVSFFGLQEQTFECFGIKVSTQWVLHPGTTLAYRIDLPGKSIVYCPDHEILPENVTPELSGEAERFAQFAEGASLLIHDCAYSRAVYESKRGWGHSTGACLAAVAAAAQVQRVLLFHHDPDNDDEAVQKVHDEFVAALTERNVTIASEPAREGATYFV